LGIGEVADVLYSPFPEIEPSVAQPEILNGLLGVSSRDAEGVEGCIGCGDGVSAFPSGGFGKEAMLSTDFFLFFGF